MVELEAQIQEILGVGRNVRGDRGLGAERTNLEDGLHLVKLGPGMLPGEHLDDQAPDAPYVGLLRVRDLLDDLGGHPID